MANPIVLRLTLRPLSLSLSKESRRCFLFLAFNLKKFLTA